MRAYRLPFLLHFVIETLAAISFLFAPERQLPAATREARLILQSYGGLLLTSNWICLVIGLRDVFDSTSRLVGLAMASYHIFPMLRAYARISEGIGMRSSQRNTLGGPHVHLFVHAICLLSFLALFCI